MNPAAAEHVVAGVEHRGLPGRDGNLRLVEHHLGAAVVERAQARGRGLVAMAICTSPRIQSVGAVPDTQFTCEAVRLSRASASFGPTVTSCASASIATT